MEKNNKNNIVQKLAHSLSKLFINSNIAKVAPLMDECENGSGGKFLVDNESRCDDESTVCLTLSTSLCTNTSMEGDFADDITFVPENFTMILLLGTGTYGSVFLAEYYDNLKVTKEKQKYAIKKLSKSCINPENIKQIMDEKNILEELDNPFTLKLYGTCQTTDELFLVTELLECGELFSAIYENEKLTNEACIFYSTCIILGLDHIHSKGIVFRDLKPENIMIDSMGYPRIVDFGLSKHLPSIEVCTDGTIRKKTHCTTLCGTPEYFAPEIIFGKGYEYAVDIWALGVIMYEMIMRTTVFKSARGRKTKHEDDLSQMFTNIAITQKNGILLSKKVDILPHARNLITQLLSGDPKKRLAGEDMPGSLLNHECFSTIKNNVNDIYNRSFMPPILQPKYDGEYNFTNTRYVSIYLGDQEIFKDF